MLAFLSFDLELTLSEKSWTFLENILRESNKSQPLRKKITVEAYTRVWKAWEEKLGKDFLWEMRPFKRIRVSYRIERANRMPRAGCLLRGPEYTPSFHLWLMSVLTSNRK